MKKTVQRTMLEINQARLFDASTCIESARVLLDQLITQSGFFTDEQRHSLVDVDELLMMCHRNVSRIHDGMN